MRCDELYYSTHYQSQKFQSTHLHEVRPPELADVIEKNGFNPRTYMRCDHAVRLRKRGATCFNPRTYMRCDACWSMSDSAATSGFNPRTYMRCDCKGTYFFRNLQGFNPRTYMRCDVAGLVGVRRSAQVSIHAPT